MIKINNIDELQKIGNDPKYPLNGEYELTQDIDASDTINWNNGAGFKPIGTQKNPFIGKFDGKGYKIKNLYINREKVDYIGLFGCIDLNGKVQNLFLKNCWIKGNEKVGGLIGLNGGTVCKCYNEGYVCGNDWAVGRLIGHNNRGTLNKCYSTGYVYGKNGFVGGLVGYNEHGKLDECYSTGYVYGENGSVGGLVGYNDGYNEYGKLDKCYSTGYVYGENGSVGGLVGCNNKGTVNNCYSVVSVFGPDDSICGLVGNNEGGIINDSYHFIRTMSGKEGMMKISDMKKQETYKSWDFKNTWAIEEEVNYPYLCSLGKAQEPNIVTKKIRTIEELSKIGLQSDYLCYWNYELAQDIDASKTQTWDNGKGFKPIGINKNPFVGKFNGNGHVIKNLYINCEEEDDIGLFSELCFEGEIKYLGLENCEILGRSCVGSIVGWNYGSSVSKCYTREGSVCGYCSVGGLAGKNDNGIIGECYSTCFVSGPYSVSGLVGINNGIVNNSYYDIENPNIKTTTGTVGGIGKLKIDMKKRETYENWDFVNIWDIKEDITYPFFR